MWIFTKALLNFWLQIAVTIEKLKGDYRKLLIQLIYSRPKIYFNHISSYNLADSVSNLFSILDATNMCSL